MKFFSMLLPSSTTRIPNQKSSSQRNSCQSDQTNGLEVSFEHLELEEDHLTAGVEFGKSYCEGKLLTVKEHQPNAITNLVDLHDSGFSFERSPNQTNLKHKSNSDEPFSNQLYKDKTIRKRSHRTVRRQFKLQDCSFDNTLNLNTISSVDSDKQTETENSLELNEQIEDAKSFSNYHQDERINDQQLSTSPKSNRKDSLKSNTESTGYLFSKDEFKKRISEDLNQTVGDALQFRGKLKKRSKHRSSKQNFNNSNKNSQAFKQQEYLSSKSHSLNSLTDEPFRSNSLTKVNQGDCIEISDKVNNEQQFINSNIQNKTVTTSGKTYLRLAAVALENSSCNVWGKKQNNRHFHHYNGSMFNLNLNAYATYNHHHHRHQPKQTMFIPIKFKTQKCRIKAFQSYRSKSLTQIDCLDDQESNRREDKQSISVQKEATSSIHLSPQHSQQHYLQCTESIEQQCRSNQQQTNRHYHAIHQSQPESSIDTTDFTSGSLTTSGHSTLNAAADSLIDSLIVPNLNQITSSTSSSKENDEQFPIKTIVHRGNSADTHEDQQQSLRKQKPQSFNQHKRRGAVMVSCENLLDDNASTQQYKATSTAKSQPHHVARKTGSIFSNPFKNEKEKMEQLTEILNYYSMNGIPNLNSNYEARNKSISRQISQQQSVRTHHSTGSISSSLSNLLGGATTNAVSTTITTTTNQQQQSSSIGQHIHSVGPSFSSTTGMTSLATAMLGNTGAIAAAGIGLPSSQINSINQSNLAGSIKMKQHAPLRNSKSTSSSLMTSQTAQAIVHAESNVQSIKEDPLTHSFEQPYQSNSNEKQKAFKNQIKISKQSSLEQTLAEEELMYLESDWSVIVKNSNELNKKMHNQQDGIWELLKTEVSYIQKMRVITNLFRDCLISLQRECLLNDIDIDKIFSNIDEVINANLNFWKNYLLIMLNHSRYTGDVLNPMLMAKGFFQFDEIFSPYRTYCVEHLVSLAYVKKKQKESELFKAYVAWCETRKDCERLHMVDLLVNPMQRLTKYSLLLKMIQTKTEDEEQLRALKQMNENVERFVASVDSSLCKRNQLEKLNLISKRIESYDAIESNNDEVDKIIKEYRDLNLIQPMPGCSTDEVRQLLLEASGLKLKDSYNSSKIDVHCLLFTDFLLICKQISKRTSDRLKIIRQPFLVNRLRTHELKDQSGLVLIYLNELSVASTFFTLYTNDTRIWIQKLKEAKKIFKNLQQTSKEKEKLEQLMKNKPSLQIMKSTEDEYFEDYYDLSGTIQTTSSNLAQQHPFYNQQQQQLMLSSQFSSSRSSLIKSQSNSIDQSEASAYGSNLVLAAPASTPNPLFNSQISCCSNCGQHINIHTKHQQIIQQQTANQQLAHTHQLQHEQQSSFTSTTLGSISTLESCSICNLPNVFVNPTTNTTNSSNVLMMNTGYHAHQQVHPNHQPSSFQKAPPPQPSAQQIMANMNRNQVQILNPNQIHSKYLLNANMSLMQPDNNNQQRAISFELGELRNPSITVDDLDCLGRSQSMERPSHSPAFLKVSSLRPERRAFLIKGRPTNTTGIPIANAQLVTGTYVTNPNLIAAFPSSSNSASIDSTTGSHPQYCNQCKNMVSLSSSDNNYNIVIAAGGLTDQVPINRSITTSNSSLQPTHSQQTSHLRQVRSLEKEYNPSIDKEEQLILPVPNISKIYGHSLDEFLDKSKPSPADNEKDNTSKPIVSTIPISASPTGSKKPALIKMKNVNLNSVASQVVLPGNQTAKSAPSSGQASPSKNLSFDSDIGDLPICDPGDYTGDYHQSKQQTVDCADGESRLTPVSKRYILTADNPSTKSSLDESESNEQNKTGEFKLSNIPSFLIENKDEEARSIHDNFDKNDLNNNSLI